MATIIYPLVICVAGLMLYIMCNNPPNSNSAKLSECGKIAFGVGLFFVTWLLMKNVLHLP
jgi:hypothetical protein